MSTVQALLVVLAGVGAGTINAIVGSGSLLTFPTLLLLGIPPVTANISNNIGMLGGGLTGTWGYRRELRGAGPVLKRLVPVSVVGSAVGAILLLALPSSAFQRIVPVLIGLGLVLVLAGRRIQAWVVRRRPVEAADTLRFAPLAAGILLAAMYGGYFGAAQGVILMGLLSALVTAPLQTLNGYKNVLAFVANSVAAVVFLLIAREHIDWTVVLLIGLGTFIGGFVGAGVGRRLPAPILRAVIVVVGVLGIIKVVWFS